MHSHRCSHCDERFTCAGEGCFYDQTACKACDKRLCSDDRPCHLCRAESADDKGADE